MATEVSTAGPVSIEIPVAWGDMDALGHVNNTVFLRWLESVRVVYLEKLDLGEGMQKLAVGPVLARQEINYRQPITYPDSVRVEATVSRIGNTSLTMDFKIWSVAKNSLAAEGSGVAVLVDYKSGQKVPVPQAVRQAIETLQSGSCS